ncbi:MAG: hypothetical protein ALECFALPRED_006950 [Alectoria fallacina]|uniref:Uncharacterized protein n=1 Tax=Alectoria fallacina TaxID=1903189 RepID=A0A8H3G5S2_9LECA|nr:MAG: hypothetical protein ALECFALPRED_006950 [Alectoria fallacina]
MGGPPLRLEPDPKSSQPDFDPHIPAYVTSLEEAQNSFYYHQNRCLKEASATMDNKALQGAAILKISHRISSLQIEYNKKSRLQSPNHWDPLLRECEEIVNLATFVVKGHNHSSNNSSSEIPMFFMDMSIVGPLFSIAHGCRDPIIRRGAVALL